MLWVRKKIVAKLETAKNQDPRVVLIAGLQARFVEQYERNMMKV